MEKIINRLIDGAVVNVDKYINGGSTWLIFTESKQWVIELTKDGTLWYNYNFFKNLFAYMSMDVVENQQYITNWVEDNIINGVKTTLNLSKQFHLSVEDTIQNGVKETCRGILPRCNTVEDTIQNGVTRTINHKTIRTFEVEDTLQHGVKETKGINGVHGMNVTIQNGVKETKLGAPDNRDYFIELAIKEGVKDICNWKGNQVERVKDTIQNGMNVTIQNGVKHTVCSSSPFVFSVKDTLQHGVKETIDLEMNDENIVEYIIETGVKHTLDETHHRRREVVRTIRDGIKQTCAQIPSIDAVVERVVEEGIKETYDDVYHHTARVEGVIKNSIKEVQPLPAQDGNMDWGVYYHRQEDRTKPHILYVKDVIENGMKEIIP